MSSKTVRTTSESEKDVEAAIEAFMRKLEGANARRAGAILLRLTGAGAGDYYVHTASGGCTLSRESGVGAHHFEVVGDSRRVCPILDGSKEGRRQFLEGGIRIRGDLRYASKVLHEMGLIKERF